ncbi:MAG: helix-turn-helix domain-containing protein [Clostridia bacterium]|nr:helix-turn-helix domain-containing protein [Clostridia bacterium]
MLEKYPDVLTPDHVIEILNIGRNKVYEMLNNGTIKSIRIGRKHRIPKKILIEYLENS